MAMTTTFELWDLETGNALGDFPTEHDALRAVLDAAKRHGREYIESWGLARVTAIEMSNLGEGIALLDRARSLASLPTDTGQRGVG